jgi:hypothetical protein
MISHSHAFCIHPSAHIYVYLHTIVIYSIRLNVPSHQSEFICREELFGKKNVVSYFWTCSSRRLLELPRSGTC